ncbi:MAG TPA: 50S ribosomal protein L4 [Dehalococcoidia bacterium]
MQLKVWNRQGEEVGTLEVADEVFGLEPNVPVIHQTMLAQLANRRAGTASTKTRGEVRGSTVKIRRQKGTGRARQGSNRAPHRTGGGVVFGPKPRDFSQRIPKRMRRLAIRSVLSAKAADGELKVVEDLAVERPRTKDVQAMLEALGATRSVLLVTGEPDRTLFLSARNIPRSKTIPAAYLNVLDMLQHRDLVMSVDAVRKAEALWGGERATRRRAAVPAGE